MRDAPRWRRVRVVDPHRGRLRIGEHVTLYSFGKARSFDSQKHGHSLHKFWLLGCVPCSSYGGCLAMMVLSDSSSTWVVSPNSRIDINLDLAIVKTTPCRACIGTGVVCDISSSRSSALKTGEDVGDDCCSPFGGVSIIRIKLFELSLSVGSAWFLLTSVQFGSVWVSKEISEFSASDLSKFNSNWTNV